MYKTPINGVTIQCTNYFYHVVSNNDKNKLTNSISIMWLHHPDFVVQRYTDSMQGHGALGDLHKTHRGNTLNNQMPYCYHTTNTTYGYTSAWF